MRTLLKTLGILILINSIIIAFYLLAPMNPKIALFAALLLTFNYLFYRLFTVKANNDLSKLESGITQGEVTKGVKLLRYAACALAFVSFITTAQGMSQFVFKGVEWQAYMASFAVQSILIIFSFLFFHFYVKVNNKTGSFPPAMSRFITYCIVLLFTLSLAVSTTFSFVYIANNTYASMRAKNSNIIIEGFFSKEVARLRRVNEEIGKEEKDKIAANVGELADELVKAAKTVKSENESILTEIVNANQKNKEPKYERRGSAQDADDLFLTHEELNTHLAAADPEDVADYNKAYEDYKGFKYIYDKIYYEYGQRFDYYERLRNNPSLLGYTANQLRTEQKTLNDLIKQIEGQKEEIAENRGAILDKFLSPFRATANDAYERLKTAINALISFYNIFIPALEQCTASMTVTDDNNEIISDLYSLVSANEYDEGAVKNIQDFLNQKRADIAVGTDNSNFDKWIIFTHNFNAFVEYSKLKKDIDSFSDLDMSISYYIVGKDEDKQNNSGNIKYVNEEEWKQARKEDFVQFVSLLKMLPDLEQYRRENGSANANGEAERTSLIAEYEPAEVLDSAYRYNRDLLEDINNIEKALNYFKYDFQTMAIFSLALALFMDFASFLTGCFMFATSFFAKRGDKSPEENG